MLMLEALPSKYWQKWRLNVDVTLVVAVVVVTVVVKEPAVEISEEMTTNDAVAAVVEDTKETGVKITEVPNVAEVEEEVKAEVEV
jgi:hypothetical protein